MQAYLDWEFGLVEQLKRDGTHGFGVQDVRSRCASGLGSLPSASL
jgi:hypothetical protein